MVRKNHRFTLAARPVGLPRPTDFAFEEADLRELGDVHLRVRAQRMVTPGIREVAFASDATNLVADDTNSQAVASSAAAEQTASNVRYTAQAFITTDLDDNQITAFHPGAIAIGSVVESKHPRFAVGAHVSGIFGLQEYAI